ncbi:MAG: aldo/keto reductase [Candidatus Binatia bacterium]
MGAVKPSSRLSRRDLLRGGALTAVGVGLSSVAGGAAEAPAEPRSEGGIRRHNPLGKTGMKISDVSFGSSRLRGDEDLVRHAFDLGINYFDSAESYTGGTSETTIGKALAGKRDRVYLTSKTETSPTTRRGEMMRALEGSLRRLRTDYVDVYFNHAVNDVERMKNPEWAEFVAAAKKQGKIRFSGMSGHAGELIRCLDWVIENRSVDVVLVAYNFGQDPAFYRRFLDTFDFIALQPDLPRVLARAKEAGIGVVAMKTLMGARLNDMRPYETGGATFAQAAFRWVLSNPSVDALIVSMTSRPSIDEYVEASGWSSTRAGDLPLLHRYALRRSDAYCRFGCDLCHASCPNGVAISEVLRARMYAFDYRDPRLAREEYARLGTGAEACISCEDPSCAEACPHGLPIAELTRSAHGRLRS